MVKKTKVDRIRNKLNKEDKEFKKLVAYLQPSVSYIDVMGQHLNVILDNSKLRKEKADFSRFRHNFAPVKDRMDKLLEKQNELFAKLKELETENLKLKYAIGNDKNSLNRYNKIDIALKKYENIDKSIKEIKELNEFKWLEDKSITKNSTIKVKVSMIYPEKLKEMQNYIISI